MTLIAREVFENSRFSMVSQGRRSSACTSLGSQHRFGKGNRMSYKDPLNQETEESLVGGVHGGSRGDVRVIFQHFHECIQVQ